MGLGTSPTFADKMLLIWKYGGRLDFWLRNIEAIAGLLKTLNLKPVAREHLANAVQMYAEMEKGNPGLRRWDFPGGIRMPHLHFKGEIFLLNEEQWKTFVKQTLTNLQERLGSAKAVSFEGIAEISEAIYAHT